MERKIKTLTYLSCLCCEKTFSLEDLIETSSNALVIGNQTIEICDIFLELFIYKVSDEDLLIEVINVLFCLRLTLQKNRTYAMTAKNIWFNFTSSKKTSKSIKVSRKL